MNDTAITWHRRLYDRLRGWGGLMLGLIIGAVAFGVSTAGAGPTDDLQDPGASSASRRSAPRLRVWRRSGSGPGTARAVPRDRVAPPPTTTTPVSWLPTP